ncbi:MAG: metalloregulator ArsR/SmtB family transcription factor [Anaerolineae bacterium]|nr:metalloregulator ArsR/SmtB family transcription factor [Anaerolineae bacterium]
MTNEDLQILLQFFKTLGDESRLKIVGLLVNQERSVGELASLLDLKEPTVSHHLSKLKNAGLVSVRAEGTTRLYRLDLQALEDMNRQLLSHDQIASWVDEVEADAGDRKVLRDYFEDGRLRQIPTKQKKLLVVLRWLADQFEPGVTYTEREINTIIEQYHDDYASLRRNLVEYGFLQRESSGGQYWLAPADTET